MGEVDRFAQTLKAISVKVEVLIKRDLNFHAADFRAAADAKFYVYSLRRLRRH